ncbi:MAG: hypothetical protein K2X87_07955 [Gemmataceae bacterium]|nr:hypothetical protein [Gemmataceae bacterium]
MLSAAVAGLSLLVANSVLNFGAGAKFPLAFCWLFAAAFLFKPAVYSVFVVRRFAAEETPRRVALAVGSLVLWLAVLAAGLAWWAR